MKMTTYLNRRNQSRYRVDFITGALLLFALSVLLCFQRYAAQPRGCNVVEIWSHRGHLDASDPDIRDWTCDRVLMELKANGIRHLDIDVLYHEGQSVVAHPSEMGDNLGELSRSPCSKVPLKTFFQKLKRCYGPGRFFVTIEPKAAWMGEGDFLAPPEDAVKGILEVLEEVPIPNLHCGIILQGWQLQDRRVSPLEYRIKQHCRIALPLKQSDAPLSEIVLPANKELRLIMPSVELFGNADGDRFLKKSKQQGLTIVLWIVDTFSTMREILLMRGVHGVISNNPVRLKRMYEQICHGKYTVRDTLG